MAPRSAAWPHSPTCPGSDGGVLQHWTSRVAPPWARTVSNRRPLVRKTQPDCPTRFTRRHSVGMPSSATGSCPLCPRIVGLCLRVLAHSWHNGGLVWALATHRRAQAVGYIGLARGQNVGTLSTTRKQRCATSTLASDFSGVSDERPAPRPRCAAGTGGSRADRRTTRPACRSA